MNIIAKTEKQKKFAEKMLKVSIVGLKNIEINRGENNEFSKLSKKMREYLENYNGEILAQDIIEIGKSLEKYNTNESYVFLKPFLLEDCLKIFLMNRKFLVNIHGGNTYENILYLKF